MSEPGGSEAEALGRLLAAELPGRPLDGARAGERLLAMLTSAERRWPAVRLDRRLFVRHLATLVRDDDVNGAVDELHGDDLYLACACLQGNAAATQIFEREYLAMVQLPPMRAAASADFVDEVRQQLRERVLAGKARIRGYSGKGPLRGWLRVAATRLALDLESDSRRRKQIEAFPDGPASESGPEQEVLRHRYQRALELAFQHAFDTLGEEQRRLLRRHYIDGVSLQELGDQLGVDRSTASRRVAAARVQLLEAVKRELRERLQLTPTSVDTLVRALKDDLHITLRALRQ